MGADTSLDRRLIELYAKGRSIEQVSEDTGIPPEQVASRTELALRRDLFSEDARILLILRKLEEMADEIHSRVPTMSDRNISAAVNAAAGAFQRVLTELRKLRAEGQADLDTVSKRHKEAFLQIIDRATQRTIGSLSERFSDVPVEDIESEFREHILTVAREVDEE